MITQRLLRLKQLSRVVPFYVMTQEPSPFASCVSSISTHGFQGCFLKQREAREGHSLEVN